MQDVRLEERWAASSVHEGLERLTGLKGELAPGPRAKDDQRKKEKCMGGTYAGVWGALSDRVIPVPKYGAGLPRRRSPSSRFIDPRGA